ncbi:MAG TPA: hypothetical protein VGD59_05515 [Acidisarcina sp.]
MTNKVIALLEVAMLLGIFASMFFLPRTMRLSSFIAMSVGVFVVMNVLVFTGSRKVKSGGSYRPGYRAYLAMTLLVVYVMICIFLR